MLSTLREILPTRFSKILIIILVKLRRGDCMYKRWWDFALVLILSVLLPVLMLSFLPKKHSVPNNPPNATAATEITILLMDEGQASQSKRMISVMSDAEKVEQMDLEDYIVCVVLAEMPASFENEALKAQAVVARTYALRRGNNNPKHYLAAVCTNSECCQGYKTPQEYIKSGGQEKDLEKIKAAVQETAGQVLAYNGELIEATYFSCSGGFTEDAVAVWGEDIPYLQATVSPGEESSKHYVDTVYFSSEEFAAFLGQDMQNSPDSWFGDISYTTGKGVETMQIGGVCYTGTQLRKLLGLRSTVFSITVVGDTIAITTKGYGHRVGMSQYGANAMAEKGSNYEEILRHYYNGTYLTVAGSVH